MNKYFAFNEIMNEIINLTTLSKFSMYQQFQTK